MSYFERYKKRTNKYGTTQNELVKKQALKDFDRNFEHVIGCTEVVINNDLETQMIIESMQDDFQKTAITRPGEQVKIGDYLTFNERTWIVKTINFDVLTPICQLLWCNQQINLAWSSLPLPCHANNTTYGSKGIADIGSKFFELDSKTKIYLQKNEVSDLLEIGHRIMLNHRYIYKIAEVDNTVYNNIYVLTCEMVEANDMDDFENNIAYNAKVPKLPDKEVPPIEESPSIPITLKGSDTLKRRTEGIYELTGATALLWEIDEEALAQIEIINSTSVKLTALNRAGWITLTSHYEDPQTQTISTLSQDILIT